MEAAQLEHDQTAGDAGRDQRLGQLRVFLIDDCSLVHAGLLHIFRDYPDICLVDSTRDSSAALEACLDSSIDAVVVNTSCRSIDIGHLIHRVHHYSESGVSRMLLLTNDLGESLCLEADNMGTGGLLLAWETPRFLVSAIRLVAGGYRIDAPDRGEPDRALPRRQSSRHEALDLLTLRERQVLKLMARGMKNAEIAGELVVSESTVKTHVQNLLVKLGLRNRASAVAVAYDLGITRASMTG